MKNKTNKKQNLELRMYCLVIYNCSPIQAGIQSLHAVVEYAQKYFKDEDYQSWAKKHKTVILLNGGTTNSIRLSDKGSLQMHLDKLSKNKIKHTYFCEPDLNDAMTCVCFLADERVFNKEKYPDIASPEKYTMPEEIEAKETLKMLGSKQNVFLREFLKDFKLANN